VDPAGGVAALTDHSFENHKIITCPNKDKLGIMEKAAKACKEFNEKLSARKKAAWGKRDQTKGGNTGLLSKLSSTQIKALSADQLRSFLISESGGSPSKKPRGDIHTFPMVALKQILGFLSLLRVTSFTSPC
jgi:hypothetical protein